jgi:type I restriction enzyme S subunit
VSLSSFRLGDFFRSRRQKGRPGLPVLSVTMNGGLVHRDTLDRKTNGSLRPEEHLLIRNGDIAYNMMRMWQGASGLAENDGIVSPAYVVVAPKDDIDPVFASYWFKSARMIYLFWAYSYGITGDRLRLYYKDFAKIPVSVPSKAEQQRIGRVLASVDRAIERTNRLIEAKRKLKKGLAQQLLTGQQRLPGLGAEWQTQQLSELVTLHFSGVDKKSQTNEQPVQLCNYTDVYYNDCITPDLDFMQATASKTEIDKFSLKQWDVIITKDSETPEDIAKPAVVMRNMPNVVCGYHLAILRPTDIAGPFLAQLLRLPRTRYEFYRVANGVTRFGLTQSTLSRLELTIPSDDEQTRIAAVLGTADRSITLLEKKLAALDELKRGLMQKLLNPDETGRQAQDGF